MAEEKVAEEFEVVIKVLVTPRDENSATEKAAAAAAAHIAARVDPYPINTNGCDVEFKTV